MSRPPSPTARLVAAAIVGVLSALVVVFDYRHEPPVPSDFDQVHAAATALWSGRNPYAAIGPGSGSDYWFPFYYPLPAAVIALPLAQLPLLAARILFVAVPGALLAFLATRHDWSRLPLFLSGAYVASVKLVQWSPLLACAVFAPVLGFAAAGKPNLGLVALSALTSRRALLLAGLGAGLLTAASFAMQPGWFGDWLTAVRTAHHFQPYLTVPGGPLLLLALLRWRRWEGRLLGTLAAIPQTPGANAMLLLLLIPRTRIAVSVLSLLTFVPLLGVPMPASPADFDRYATTLRWVTAYTCLFPALYLVLRMPNVGPAPAWLEALVARLPRWLRGDPGRVEREP